MPGIPKNAKNVYKGIIFDVFQWKQKLFNGKAVTFEKATRPNNVTVIASVKDKIIFLQQKQPSYDGWYMDLPGGRMDEPGEKPKDCAKRELFEETGYSSSDLKLLNIFHWRGHINYKTYLFVARDCKKLTKQSLDGGEIIKLKLISYEQLKNMTLEDRFFTDPNIKLFLTKARLNKKFDHWLKRQIFG